MKLLEIKKLSVKYEDKPIISGLSFDVCEGDFICIVGENGSGKSTLLKAIIGELPSKKSIKYCGIKKSEIGYIAQRANLNENFPATVEEIVASGCLNKPSFGFWYSRTIHEKTKVLLAEFGIEKLSTESFVNLSGGQRQKVLVARALMASDKLLILDEPSNNLDQKSRAELYNHLEKLNKEGLAVIMVTHDLDHGNLIGNKILSLSKNNYFFGTTEEYVEKIHA